ncbi:MAG: exopolysaccharide biosynthesis polyprenyl glycosylphosphotransferase [Coprobacillus sp.]|nr:exopolysaccharide biosynthesis polyprenyl glycosylphosphotransferase [Coprobacillus sp.]
MKKNIYSFLLFLIEVLLFYMISIVLKIPTDLMCRIGLIWFIVILIFKHYKIESTLVWDEIRSDAKAFIYYSMISFAFLYPQLQFYLKVVGIGFFMFCVSVFVNRFLRILLRDVLARKTLIIGTGEGAYRIGKISHHNRFALTKVVGFIKDDDVNEDLYNDDLFDIFEYELLDNIIEEKEIEQVIIAVSHADQAKIDEISKKIFNKVEIIKILPELNFTMAFNSEIIDFDGELLISTSRGKSSAIKRKLKRIIDISAGICGCLLLLPLTLWVIVMNKKNGDTGPIFFKQERIGYRGKSIYIYKYRSMVLGAEEILEELMENDSTIKEEYLTHKKLAQDPRITKVGQFLRKTSLDEFPQFINILKGEMSLVGPRPYLLREKEDMDIYYESIIKCKPGLTGMWQANGRSNVGFKDRCKLDDYYHRNWTLGLDLIIIYKTIKSVFYGKGAL